MNPIMLMRQFSIRTRMYGAIIIVLLLLMLVGASGIWGIRQVQQLGEDFTSSTFKKSMISANVRVAMAELRGLEKDMVIQYEKVEEVEKIEVRWKGAIERLNQLITDLTSGSERELNEIAKDLPLHLRQYTEFAQPVVNNIKASSFDTAGVANRMLRKAHAELAKAEEAVRLVDVAIARQAEQTQADQKAASRAALTLFLVVVGGAIVTVVPSTLLNMQSICRPTEQAQAFAASVASGDLTQDVDVNGRDEMAQLLIAQKDMQSAISRIVTEVYRASDSIRTASAEIASGNMDLSGRTEMAASNLQETAASMQELIDNVKGAAEAARSASASAQANAAAALKGGHAVSEVIATMQEINQSSKKISDIIGVIDGIAFQTNILALNAAVEAARAGEAGRGFAVVASEVRVLAQRSAAAAREIKALIGNSVEKVEIGTSQVNQAGQTISNVVASAQEVSKLIAGITSSSAEQSQGIVEINAAITKLDQMTQQNSALVEESAAASHSLQEQAERLSTLVSVFKVRGPVEQASSAPRLTLG